MRTTNATRVSGLFALVLTLLIASVAPVAAQQTLPAEKAGTISKQPPGQIAFNRNGNIWVMNADGTNQRMVTEVTNADGRMSFSPDNRQIVFTRSGTVDLKGPDMLGGKHKVYDLFLAYIDSVDAGNSMWWMRITENLGSREPEWQPDGSIVYLQDMNANRVDATLPNYQIVISDGDGSNPEVLRKDWQNMGEFFMNPTMNPKTHDIAFVHFYDLKAQGMAILNRDHFMVSLDSVHAMSDKNVKRVAPAYSLDGKWLAYVYNDMNKAGIYITTPDMSEHYLVWSPPVNVYPRTVAPCFSPDSKWLTFGTTDGSIWICDITGNGARRLTVPGSDRDPAWSKPPKK